jgi:hypothetical protein
LEYRGVFTKLLKKMSNASKNIFRVYHIRIIAPKKMVHTT